MDSRRLKSFGKMFVDAASRFTDDRCFSFGASVAYYAVFSIFPLLLLSVSIVGFVLGDDDSVRERVLSTFSSVTSISSRQLLDETLKSMQTHRTARGVGAVVGVIALVYGASNVFSELETSLDSIWHVDPPKNESTLKTVLRAVKDKAFAFLIVIGTAVLLVASLAVNTTLTSIADASLGAERGGVPWRVLEMIVSLVVQTALFATIFRVVPHAKVRWRDVIAGAFVTAIVVNILKAVFGWYLSGIGSYAAYGAVGAVLALLTWIYVAALALFFGAELSRAYAERFGSMRGAVTRPGT